MDDQIKYSWQQTVVDAFLSLPRELSERVAIAEQAISARLKTSHELDFSERIALDDARRALRILASETNFPAGKYGQGGQKKIA
jgi:hypothetical protein